MIVPRTPTPEQRHILYDLPKKGASGNHREWMNRDEALGIFRLNIDGRWTLDDFASLLKKVNDIYTRLWSALFVAEALQRSEIAALLQQVETATAQPATMIQRVDTARAHPSAKETLARFVNSTTRTMAPLTVRRIALFLTWPD
jgi:hypothetical protein